MNNFTRAADWAGRIPPRFIFLLIFVTAFVPRCLALDAYVAPDEGKWIYRSAHFLQALVQGDFARMTSVAATPEVEVLAPAVPTMWLGAAGLAAKYWYTAGAYAISLPEYLNRIPAATEKITLDFYPWTRFPTVLLTSLALTLIYFLLSKLIGAPSSLLATLLLGLDPFFLGLSRVIHHDALVATFIFLSLLMLLLHRQRQAAINPSRVTGWLIGSGVAGGLALLTKPTALYLALFVTIFLLLGKGLPRRRIDWQSVILESLGWGVTVLAICFLLWPALWVAPLDTLTSLLERSANAVSDNNSYSLIPGPDTPLPELGFLFYPINWLFKVTPAVLGGLILLCVKIWRIPKRAASPWWTVKWLAIFSVLFLVLLLPASTRDIRYFLPVILVLHPLVATGLIGLNSIHKFQASESRWSAFNWFTALLMVTQLALVSLYYPYYVDYLNPLAGGPWLAPRLIKIGSGEGLDQIGRYLDQKPAAASLRVATSFWESFVPFFSGPYTKPHYNEEADYIVIYIRQIQNNNPFPEYWPYFAARPPEYKVSLVGLDYAWLYPGPQLREVREVNFGDGLILRGYRLDRRAAQPGQMAQLTLVWGGTAARQADQPVGVQVGDPASSVWLETGGPVLDTAGPSAVEGHYTLTVPPNAPRGDYPLTVFANQLSYQIGQIPIRQLDKPALPLAAEVNFGELITLAGVEVIPFYHGSAARLKLLWQARQPIPQSYTTFVHLVDAQGNIWGQADRVPQVNGAELPTNHWEMHEWIVDDFEVSLKPDAPAGSYTVLVGVYNSQTLERLPIMEAAATVAEITSITLPPLDGK